MNSAEKPEAAEIRQPQLKVGRAEADCQRPEGYCQIHAFDSARKRTYYRRFLRATALSPSRTDKSGRSAVHLFVWTAAGFSTTEQSATIPRYRVCDGAQ